MCEFWKSDHDFVLKFSSNHTSIMHSFRFNQVFPLAGNDVIVLSPQGALQLNYMCEFWKSYRNLILVFNSNHTSVMHRFRYNQVLPFAGNDVIVLSSRGALQTNSKCGFWKGYRDLILVFNNNHTSIIHSFWFIQVFPLAGNDVIVSSPQRSAAAELFVRTLKGWPRLHLNV